MTIRVKMRLENIFAVDYGGVKAIFRALYDAESVEDKRFSLATPHGLAEFHIDNPAVAPLLVIGQSYYFDITPVTLNVAATQTPLEVPPTPPNVNDALVTDVARVNPPVFRGDFRERHEFGGVGVTARHVDQARRDAPGPCLHPLIHQVSHRVQFVGCGATFRVSHHRFANRAECASSYTRPRSLYKVRKAAGWTRVSPGSGCWYSSWHSYWTMVLESHPPRQYHDLDPNCAF